MMTLRMKKASLKGSFSFPSVQFVKLYLKAGHDAKVDKQPGKTSVTITTWGDPVEYEGSMSEDGKTISGRWMIASKNGMSSGTWTASRI